MSSIPSTAVDTHRRRMRSSSDPFVDPHPNLHSHPNRAPPPPPKDRPLNTATNDRPHKHRNTRSQTAPRRSQSQEPTEQKGRLRRKEPLKHTDTTDKLDLSVSSQYHEPTEPRAKARNKKDGSRHADVIDRLDFTGVGSHYHHDGPFDACAPSRNRRPDAPMLALSDSPIEDPHKTPYYDPPKKKVDAIAEAWGMHEPEPFEEFHAGGYGDVEGAVEPLYSLIPPRGAKLPPPKPIVFDESDTLTDEPSPTRSNAPLRRKSLLQRIRDSRKSRDTPNDDAPSSPSSSEHIATERSVPDRPAGPIVMASSLPTPRHISHNSFLGLFSRSKDNAFPAEASSYPTDTSEQFVVVTVNKSRTPHATLSSSPKSPLEDAHRSQGRPPTPPEKTEFEGYRYDDAQSPQSNAGIKLVRRASQLAKFSFGPFANSRK